MKWGNLNLMSDTSKFIEHISFIQSQTNKALSKIPLKPELTSYFYDPISYVLKGKGKRLRPILVHLAGQAFNAQPDDLMKAGVAAELLHNFSLVHDDIMDNDSKRHGQPSVHYRWDTSTAILAGDGLFIFSQLSLLGLKPVIGQRFNEVALEVCEGQGIDKQFENDSSITMQEYLVMIGKKTASFLGLCAEMGALLGDATKDESDEMFQFGFNLGIAFQIKDDLLEIFGEEKTMGKSLGSDLEENKQTVLAVLAREENEKEWLHFNQQENTLIDFKNYFTSNGIRTKAENLVENHVNMAVNCLDAIPGKKNKDLLEYSNLIMNRDY